MRVETRAETRVERADATRRDRGRWPGSSTRWPAWRTLREDTRGAQLVEYVLILGLVAIVAIGGFRLFGRRVDAKTAQQGTKVAALQSSAPGSGTDPWDGIGAISGHAKTDDGGGGLWGGLKSLAGDVVGFGAKSVLAVGNFQVKFDIGVIKGAASTVGGLFNAVIHPVDTVKGLIYVSNHPFEAAWTMGSQYVHQIQDDPAEGLGRAGFDVLFTAASMGGGAAAESGVKGVVAAQRVTNIASDADTIAGAAQAGEKGDNGKSGAPGAVKWADDWIVPLLPGVRLPFGD